MSGQISISGSKNGALPIMVCSLLTNDSLTIENVPDLSDINSMISLLQSLNSEVEFKNNKLRINSFKPKLNYASYDLVRKMRASFLVMGPLLARYGNAEVSLPGGCAIGARPINYHIKAFEKMGVSFDIVDGYVKGKVKKNLKGAQINLPVKSVGATENIMMAATLAEGETIISNAAMEPEIENMGDCLIRMGADIRGLGTSLIKINGKKKLDGCSFKVMSDRIEAGTFILAVLGCGGKVNLKLHDEIVIENLKNIFSFSDKLLISDSKDGLIVECEGGGYSPVNIITKPYPGFPTDLQAQLTAVMTKAKGVSVIEETIFENRFMHIAELIRMGASIKIKGPKVEITGGEKIFGAQVMATDLRASSSLVIAGLMAEGKTTINRVYHLDRGYEKLEEKLSQCNIKIKRLKD